MHAPLSPSCTGNRSSLELEERVPLERLTFNFLCVHFPLNYTEVVTSTRKGFVQHSNNRLGWRRQGTDGGKSGSAMADSLVAGWLSEIGLEAAVPTFREVHGCCFASFLRAWRVPGGSRRPLARRCGVACRHEPQLVVLVGPARLAGPAVAAAAASAALTLRDAAGGHRQ
jgi:hypothetical protein